MVCFGFGILCVVVWGFFVCVFLSLLVFCGFVCAFVYFVIVLFWVLCMCCFCFFPSELCPGGSTYLNPLIILFKETDVIMTPFVIPLGGKDSVWASKSFSYTWINMTLCF